MDLFCHCLVVMCAGVEKTEDCICHCSDVVVHCMLSICQEGLSCNTIATFFNVLNPICGILPRHSFLSIFLRFSFFPRKKHNYSIVVIIIILRSLLLLLLFMCLHAHLQSLHNLRMIITLWRTLWSFGTSSRGCTSPAQAAGSAAFRRPRC